MGLLNALGEILIAILGGTLQLFVEIADHIGKKNHDQKATFGKKRNVISYARSASFYIGDDAIDQHTAMNSAIIIGRTGASKSASVYKPSLLQAPVPKIQFDDPASMSYVVLDPASELEADCAGWNQKQGYTTDVINFSNVSTSSVSWNPIAGLTDSEVTRFASEYIEIALRTSGTSDPFWGISAGRVLRLAINILRAFSERYTNLYNARYIVQVMSGNREKLDLLMASSSISVDLFNEYESIINMGSKLLSSVIATTLSSLELFSDSQVAIVTSSTTLKMEEYRSQSKILFVQTKVMDQEFVSILNTLLFSSFFSNCMSDIPSKDQNTIAFMIDECSSLRMKPSLFPLACSNLRKHKSYGVFGFQSLAQIEELYGKQNAKTISQNVGTKLFFPHQDLSTSEEISRMLGRYTHEDEQGRKDTRNLLNADEVSFLEHKNGALLFSGSERGILLKAIRPYYKSRKLVQRSKIETEEREYISALMPELLPIDDLIKASL